VSRLAVKHSADGRASHLAGSCPVARSTDHGERGDRLATVASPFTA